MGGTPVTTGSQRLKDALGRVRAGLKPAPMPKMDMKPDPTNAFELQVAERLKSMQADITRLANLLNWLILFIVAAALTNVVVSMLK
jgi:hypothetical protein